ncbi:MAG: PLP-dependent aminotransferase family protein [Acidobacteria bacterium]|nr:PLP-dependent aminotransferase family protein [Acidobacteriota bacterium]
MDAQALVRQLGVWSKGRGSLHQKLALALTNAIRHGFLMPGLRLPSERALANALSVSRTTVVTVYDELRERRWLDSRPGSGTWVSERSAVVMAARTTAHATALAASPLLGLLISHDDADVIDFALGTPTPLDGLPPELFTLPPDEHAALLRDRLYYPLGLPALRRAIASAYSNEGLDTHVEQVLVTNGAQQAIALSAALCLQHGDTVLVEDPSYFGALDVCRTIGARLATVPVGVDGVSPSAIRERIAATGARLIYLTPTFQNPTGSVMPAWARKEIAQISSAAGVPLIDDRTTADLLLDGSPPAGPIARYSPSAPIFTVGSLSKLVWPGLRVGWVRAPEPLIQRLARVKTAMDLGSPLLTQAIGARVVGAIPEARRLRQRELKPRRDLLKALLRDQLPEWRFRVPSGGLFLWVQLAHADAREYAQVAFRHGIVTLPGPNMSAAEDHASFLRVPFFGEPDTLRSAADRLSAAWYEYRHSTRQRRQPIALV